MANLDALCIVAGKCVLGGCFSIPYQFYLDTYEVLGVKPLYKWNALKRVNDEVNVIETMRKLYSSRDVTSPTLLNLPSSVSNPIISHVYVRALTNVNYFNLAFVWFCLGIVNPYDCISTLGMSILNKFSSDVTRDPMKVNVNIILYRLIVCLYIQYCLLGEGRSLELGLYDFVYLLEQTFFSKFGQNFYSNHSTVLFTDDAVSGRIQDVRGFLNYIVKRGFRVYSATGVTKFSKDYLNDVALFFPVTRALFTRKQILKVLSECNSFLASIIVNDVNVLQYTEDDLWIGEFVEK